MANSNWQNEDTWGWALVGMWLRQLAVLLVAGVVIELFLTAPRPAYAQGTVITQTHSTVADWNQVCAGITNTVVANASGGELRLAATVEDYFDGDTINLTRWYTNIADTTAGGSPYVSVSGGFLTLDGAYLLSTATLTQLPRVFEARARLMQSANTSGRPDVGFWRHPTLGPRYDPDTNVGGSRIFVVGEFQGYGNDINDLLIAARNGSSTDIVDVETDPDLNQYILWRIEWEAAQTRFYANGVLTHTSVLASDVYSSWVFLYHQVPTSYPNTTVAMVDWVRAGRYPADGEYVSCPVDGFGAVWNTLWFTPTTPTNTSAQMSVRSSPDGVTWGSWSTPSASSPFSITNLGNVKFMQYRLQASTTDVMQSPQVDAVTFTRIQNATAVTVSDFQARAEWWLDWRWAVLAAGVLALGVFGWRARRT